MTTATYETDFFGWIQQQASLLRTGRLLEVDRDNLLEELETMGRSEKRELESRMTVLIMHLLKWQFQPHLQGKSWLLTIKNQRKALAKALKDSPSLVRFLNDDNWLQAVWTDAVDDAVIETGYTEDMFPPSPIWEVAQILDESFFPNDD